MKSCEGQNYFEVQQRGELLVANVVASAGAPQNHPSPPVSTAENQIEMRDESPPAI